MTKTTHPERLPEITNNASELLAESHAVVVYAGIADICCLLSSE